MVKTSLACLLAGLALTACEEGVLGFGDDSEVAFRTDRTSYALEATEMGVRVDIPFSYTNRTGQDVYVVNCNGIAPPLLEKWAEGRWEIAWVPMVPDCLSPPIVIRDGSAHRDTLRVFAGYGSVDIYPEFQIGERAGRYRLVWERVLWSFDAGAYPFGEKLPSELRISNDFTIDESH